MDDSTITFVVLGATVLLFVVDRLPVAVVALLVPLALWATGVLSLEDALAGFGDPTVLFIAALFVVSEALEAAGVTAWVGQQLVARVGGSRVRLIVLTMGLAAGLTALLNVNGAVAALVPVAVVLAVRTRHSPSQLLLPVAFAAHAGSLLALTGTPVNVIVAEEGGFGFFEFALAGVPLVLGTVLIVLLFGERLLPSRTPRSIAPDFSGHARTLVEQYQLDHPEDALLNRRSGVAEVVIPPRSALAGDRVFPGMVTPSGDLVVLAVQRRGEDVGPTALSEGDTLLLQGSWDALDRGLDELLVVDEPELVRRAVPLGAGAGRALGVLAAMVVLLASGLVPAAVAGLLAAMAMVVLRVLTVEEAQRGVSWTTVVLVGGMMSLSAAMVATGAAGSLAGLLVDVVGDLGPHALLLGLFVLTAALGQLISNMATALIVIPVALTAAADMDVAAEPVLMAVAVSAAAAFLTPVATPANLMVMEPGGYRFGDYWKLGLPLLVLFGVVAVLWVPLIWRF
ncbi:SLC13/DASS family transporter [Solirubrobacter sp. CPCC 204708]|uniref:SLC13 family permease n=1 Tax=Solirubrobacter deserti TaxID=2282478 RepID=A0ABT4RSP2_9ACTN|nr:SLC13 family permease [Solirubrobacter deserti]MBE2315931.1 SLC13/DASS family transporter [Solirubrobacter deserti]MDA0141611.1 SLC13 family permease [Solirubrobacter deserti]